MENNSRNEKEDNNPLDYKTALQAGNINQLSLTAHNYENNKVGHLDIGDKWLGDIPGATHV